MKDLGVEGEAAITLTTKDGRTFTLDYKGSGSNLTSGNDLLDKEGLKDITLSYGNKQIDVTLIKHGKGNTENSHTGQDEYWIEYGTPEGGGGTPEGGSGTPEGGSGTPEGGGGTPEGGSGTPEGGSGTPEGGSGTPDGGSGTPEGGSGTPEGGSGTPEGGSGTPEGGSGTPKDGDSRKEGTIDDNSAPRPSRSGVKTETADIVEEEVPLTELTEEVPLVELPEEEVPMAQVPETGDTALLWALVSAMSGGAVAWLTVSGRKCR